MKPSQPYNITTTIKTLPADLHTPIGIYLKLRDNFRDTILMESAGNPNSDNNFTYIGIQAIAGFEVTNTSIIEIKYPNQTPYSQHCNNETMLSELDDFMKGFKFNEISETGKAAQGLYGYISYDAIPFFEHIQLESKNDDTIPLLRFRFYQYVIAINHFTDEMHLIENNIDGLKSESLTIEKLLTQKNMMLYPFKTIDEEKSNLTDLDYLEMVKKAQKHCALGNVFQLVLSRQFQQKFQGDEFNVYRALRSINPSPYLFYYDYGDYKLLGSSPESQIIIKKGKAIMHPIAGTFKRTHNLEHDMALAEKLKNDEKENAEHTMLVDLARNDVSKYGKNTRITKLKEIHFFSHVIHMVSEVVADLKPHQNPLPVIASTFPQGTLSGAPKYKALQIINELENTNRQFYGGCLGYLGFDGSCNLAIMIRSFLSKNNTLTYQAGAGIVAKSVPENELQEVHNKLNALRTAVKKANTLHSF